MMVLSLSSMFLYRQDDQPAVLFYGIAGFEFAKLPLSQEHA
jgi:hypothetical protein